eukprot:3499607-Lingulodinium_polyedra.AAC.1
MLQTQGGLDMFAVAELLSTTVEDKAGRPQLWVAKRFWQEWIECLECKVQCADRTRVRDESGN